MLKYTVFADLNCPFSYALHEQLHQFGLLPEVEWCLVEHVDDIALYNKTAENQAELASEVFTVRSRAPGIELALPPKRSDSHFATLCLIAALEHDPDKVIAFRRALYRALWVDGKDIANVSVIYDCLVASGLPSEVSIENHHENTLSQWQRSWEEGGFNLRMPVICCSDGRKTLGLPGSEDLKNFFHGAELKTFEQNIEVVRTAAEQTIAIYTDLGVDAIWPLISAVRNHFNILLPASLTELRTLIQEDPPALLLLNTEQQWDEMLELCRELRQPGEQQAFPVAFIDQSSEQAMELAAYQAGAADYLSLERPAEILRARLELMIQQKQILDQLARSARLDGLTQVNNRREFQRSLELEWRRAQRAKRDISLIMIDIDHFKEFNDIYGHLAGDGCLRTVAQAIKNTLGRAEDSVYRYGGEEFAVVLPETSLHGASKLAERLCTAVREMKIEHTNSSTGEYVTISLGCACFNPSSDGSPNELITQADKGLYKAKRKRNCVEFYA